MGAAFAESIATQPSNTEFINFVREKFDQAAKDWSHHQTSGRLFAASSSASAPREACLCNLKSIHERGSNSHEHLTERSQTAVSVRLKK
jgi:hypothetical protein